ncbi:MFS transporter [Nakamurella deserti]|uniref:MFS transporter n=1 Tax=Nakamurella deserti TaxID=2164074 RepID=UPI000DBE373C|nr:MFS transporter [Nakamurella deserti]
MNRFRSLARNHDFTVLWTAQTASELGSRMSLFVFPLLVYAMTGSAWLAAAAEAAHLLGYVGALLPAGVLADRVDRRRLMCRAAAAGLLLHGSLVAAAAVGVLTVGHLLGVALLGGAVAGAFGPAEMSAVRAVVPRDDLPTALAQHQARQHLAGLIGGPVGGALYSVSRWLPFAVDTVTYAVSLVLLRRIRADLSAPPRTGPARRRGRDLLDGWSAIRRSPLLRVLMVWSASTNLVVNALFFVAVLRLLAGGVPAVQIGLVEGFAGVCGIVGAVLAPALVERVPTGRLTIAVAWSVLPLVVPMALWNHPVAVAVALGATVLLNPAGNAGISAYRMTVTPPELQGRVQATSQFVSMSMMPLAPVVAGAALTGLGGAAAVLLLGGVAGAVALLPTLSPTVRSVPRPAVWREAPAPAGLTVAAGG